MKSKNLVHQNFLTLGLLKVMALWMKSKSFLTLASPKLSNTWFTEGEGSLDEKQKLSYKWFSTKQQLFTTTKGQVLALCFTTRWWFFGWKLVVYLVVLPESTKENCQKCNDRLQQMLILIPFDWDLLPNCSPENQSNSGHARFSKSAERLDV